MGKNFSLGKSFTTFVSAVRLVAKNPVLFVPFILSLLGSIIISQGIIEKIVTPILLQKSAESLSKSFFIVSGITGVLNFSLSSWIISIMCGMYPLVLSKKSVSVKELFLGKFFWKVAGINLVITIIKLIVQQSSKIIAASQLIAGLFLMLLVLAILFFSWGLFVWYAPLIAQKYKVKRILKKGFSYSFKKPRLIWYTTIPLLCLYAVASLIGLIIILIFLPEVALSPDNVPSWVIIAKMIFSKVILPTLSFAFIFSVAKEFTKEKFWCHK